MKHAIAGLFEQLTGGKPLHHRPLVVQHRFSTAPVHSTGRIKWCGMLNLLATVGYFVVAATAFGARVRDRNSNARRWLLIALVFVGLAVWRLSNGEMIVQDAVRRAASEDRLYSSRGELQRPLIALIVLFTAPSMFLAWGAFRRSGQGRWMAIAQVATLVLVIYTFVRLVSLHPVDAFVYQSLGPIHVNYLIDGGLTSLTLVSAAITAFAGQPYPADAISRKKKA